MLPLAMRKVVMKRTAIRLIAALVSFFVGVSIATVWMYSRVRNMELPPCQSCAEIYSSSPEILTASVCEIVNNPERYANRTVRVQAMLHNDAGYIYLYDESRPCGQNSILYVGLTEPLKSCEGTRKTLTVHSGIGTWYDGTVSITVVGRLGHIEEYRGFYDGENGFNVLCIERVSSVGSGMLGRIRYTIGEVVKRAGL